MTARKKDAQPTIPWQQRVWRPCAGCGRDIRRCDPAWYDVASDTARCHECGPHPRKDTP